jgi:two-component system, chemotaxis family, response regulator Rcp1
METDIPRLILAIESNPDHVQVMRTVLDQVRYQVVAIADGDQALNFLHRRAEYAQAPRPDLILLDLDLPGKAGGQVLAEIKGDRQLRRIPTIILTHRDSQDDILNTYALQGNSHVLKPNELNQLLQIVKRIEEFWLEIVTLPGEY